MSNSTQKKTILEMLFPAKLLLVLRKSA